MQTLYLQNPDAAFEVGSYVTVVAEFDDTVPEVAKRSGVLQVQSKKDRPSGSGIGSAFMKIYKAGIADPDTVVWNMGDSYMLDKSVHLEHAGTYQAVLTVMDNTGNQTVESIEFFAEMATQPAPQILITGDSGSTYDFDSSFKFTARVMPPNEDAIVDLGSIRVDVYNILNDETLEEYMMDISFDYTETEGTYDVTAMIHPPSVADYEGLRVQITAGTVNGEMMMKTKDYTADYSSFEFAVTEAYVYPNPIEQTRGSVNFVIQTNRAATAEIVIYDFAGKVVTKMKDRALTGGRNEISWDCSNSGTKLARGVYFAKVVANDRSSRVEKIIKVVKQ